MLEPHETYVCGNVLLTLNRLGAFRLVKGNGVEHDAGIIKNMQFKADDRGQDLDFLALVMRDPAQFLPNKETPIVKAKEEK